MERYADRGVIEFMPFLSDGGYMHQARFALLAALCAGAVSAVQAAQDNVPAAQSGHATTYQGAGQPQWEITQPPTTRSSGGVGINAADCPPALGREAAERIDPPGPVGESGTASAMTEDSGTLGSAGTTRATSTSGATGTTGEVGNYYGPDPSGSVTVAGSTGAPIDPLAQCDFGPATSTGGVAVSEQSSQPAQAQEPVQGRDRIPAAAQPAQPRQ
jgi:hypothetical protein